MTSDIALSVRPSVQRLQADWHIPGPSRRPASQLPVLQLQLVRCHWRILQEIHLPESRMILLPRISQGPRNQDEYDMCCGKGGTHQEAPNASFTCSTWGTARQKPGRVVLRHFCDWLCVLQRGQALSTASLSPERAAVRGGDSATTRQIARGSGRCRARNSANARRTCEGIRITAA
jgi:hypothetical protein